jgi:hypothetical protein
LNVLNVSSRRSRRALLDARVLRQAQVFVHVKEPEDVGEILAAVPKVLVAGSVNAATFR